MRNRDTKRQPSSKAYFTRLLSAKSRCITMTFENRLVLDASYSPAAMISDVVLPGVIDAIECGGTLYRFDDMPIYSKPITSPPFEFTESTEHTLKQILEKVKGLKEPRSR